MNALHLCFGLGATTAPILVNRSLAWNNSIRGAYLIVAAVVVALAVVIGRRPSPPDPHDDVSGSGIPKGKGLQVGLVVLFFMAYVGVELGFVSWIFEYGVARGLDRQREASWLGSGFLAVEVLRHCPGDVTPGVEVSSKYIGIAGTHLGTYDPVFGGYGYYVPLVYANKAGLNTVIYIQNGGLECSSLEIWFKAQDDCLRARICDVGTLAPGETFQFDASDCVGPDWQGSAWIRASEVMGIVVDIFGRDIMMSYIGEPQPFNYALLNEDGEFDFVDSPTTGEKVAYGPLIYSEYQGWDTGVQVMNLDPVHNAKVKVYFLDRSGDIITTLVDWICPRGSQTFFLPLVANLPGTWAGSLRVESQDWWIPGVNGIPAPDIVGMIMSTSMNRIMNTNIVTIM